MPFEVVWDNEEERILRIDIDYPTTWPEYHEAIDKVYNLISVHVERVDLIFWEKSGSLPSDNIISNAKEGFRKLSPLPNFGMAVIVPMKSQGEFMKLISQMIINLYKIDKERDGGFVKSLEEAREKIAKARQQAK
jgi:hypothetical protein